MNHLRTTLRAGLGGALLVLGLTACGTGGEESHRTPAALETARNGDVFNAADAAFATAMIPHHAQAVQMANLAADRPLPDPLRTLVDDVHRTQVAEVETMVTWLTDWGREIPETSMDHANAGHDMSDMSDMGDMSGGDGGPTMPGMMDDARMTELEQASDAAFPDLWMTMMVEHHEGAITMARTEQEDGHFPAAVDLAEAIVAAQEKEIETMRALLSAS